MSSLLSNFVKHLFNHTVESENVLALLWPGMKRRSITINLSQKKKKKETTIIVALTKNMVSILREYKEVQLVDFMPKSITFDAEAYGKILQELKNKI